MYPSELNKDEIEESAIISAFCQLIEMRFKDEKFYTIWKKDIYPFVRDYSIKVLHISDEDAKKNIKIVEERRKPKITFNTLEDAMRFLDKIREEST